jgi:signal transduction histidine kinase
VTIDGKEVTVSPGEALRVSSSTRQFEFHYTALDLTAPSAVVSRAKLDGMDRDWVDPGASRFVRYSKLPPGDYQFHIMAGGADGRWVEGQSLRLVVIPQWWERGWIQFLAAVTALGATGAATRWYQRRKTRAKLRQMQMARQLEAERARIARDIHDEMGASLTQIMMLSAVERESYEPDEAIQDLDRIHTTSRYLTRAMDEVVWAVDPKHDTLESVVNYLGRTAEDSLRAGGVRCRLDFPRPIPKIQFTSRIRHNLFLLLKEALHNVAKHASATEARLAVEISDAEFSLILEDNGKGFSGSPKSGASTPNRILSGHGLENMAARAHDAGGTLEIDSQPEHGTRLILRVPLPPSTP